MRYRTFVDASTSLGAFLWAVGVTLLGYWLGETIPNIDKYLLPIIAGIVTLSLLPIGFEWLRHRKRAADSLGGGPPQEG